MDNSSLFFTIRKLKTKAYLSLSFYFFVLTGISFMYVKEGTNEIRTIKIYKNCVIDLFR